MPPPPRIPRLPPPKLPSGKHVKLIYHRGGYLVVTTRMGLVAGPRLFRGTGSVVEGSWFAKLGDATAQMTCWENLCERNQK